MGFKGGRGEKWNKKRNGANSGNPHPFEGQRDKLRKNVTGNFYVSHCALTTDPNYHTKLGNCKRPIDNSTAIILRPCEIGFLKQEIKSAVKQHGDEVELEDNNLRSRILTTRHVYTLMLWKAAGKGQRVFGKFDFSMLRLRTDSRWFIHHLDATMTVDRFYHDDMTSDDDDDPSYGEMSGDEM